MRKDMNNLILVTPTKEHESQVMEFREEMLKNGEGFYGCSGLNSVSSYDEWLDFEGRFERFGWTPSAAYLGIRISDGRLIGMIDLRHELSGFLLKYNIFFPGYASQPFGCCKRYGFMVILKKEKVVDIEF